MTKIQILIIWNWKLLSWSWGNFYWDYATRWAFVEGPTTAHPTNPRWWTATIL